jgi:ATP-binding cassette subfamily F protein 3
VLAGRPDVAALDDELRTIEAELARPAVADDLAKMDRVLTRQQAVLDRWVEAGGAGLAGEAKSLLRRFGFDEHDLTLPTAALSGGQRKLASSTSPRRTWTPTGESCWRRSSPSSPVPS